jgi:hypothetical protein
VEIRSRRASLDGKDADFADEDSDYGERAAKEAQEQRAAGIVQVIHC